MGLNVMEKLYQHARAAGLRRAGGSLAHGPHRNGEDRTAGLGRSGGVLACALAAAVGLIALAPGPHGQALRFEDVSADAGVAVAHQAVEDAARMGVGTGAAWLDFDRDGHLDLYVTQGLGANHLFRNLGDGSFEPVAADLNAGDADHAGAGVAVADYDNDGWDDIYLANSDADVLLRNDGGETFVDVSEEVGIASETGERATAAAWGDYDNDGYLDLYVVSHMHLGGLESSSRDRLFHNDGGETFSEVTHLLDADLVDAYGFAAAWTDYDRDGDADLLVVNDCPFGDASRYRPTVLYRNDGGTSGSEWSFTDVAEAVDAAHCRHGMGVAVADYDNDGWMDYFYTNIGKQTTLLRNDRGAFTDAAEEAGVFVGYNPGEPGAPIQGTFSWGASFFDVDLDGWLDLYVAAGTLSLNTQSANDPQPNVLFRNLGDGTFAEAAGAGAASTGRSRTTAYGDYDGDGDPDLYVVDVGEEGYLFRNESSGGNYLIVDLVGTASNRNGIGARVAAKLPDGSRQYREIRSGSSLGATHDRAAYFGLGDHEVVEELLITWPSGSMQTLSDVEGGRRIVVTESEAPATEKIPPTSDLTFQVYPNPTRFPVTIRCGPRPPAISSSCRALEVFDAAGRLVRRLDASAAILRWDGTADDGRTLPSGVYFVRANTGSRTLTRGLVVR